MNCPKCRTAELRNAKMKNSDIPLDTCPTCKGVWFDGGELKALLGDAAAAGLRPPMSAHSSQRLCPRCQKNLYTFYYPETFVAVDMCRKCKGMWFDAGEFREVQRVRSYIQKSGVVGQQNKPQGIKLGMLNFINNSIQALVPWRI